MTPKIRIIGDAPHDAVCIKCFSSAGRVLKIKDAGRIGGKTETLHEACAVEWFNRRK
jgi:hypothetical protein